MGIIKKFKQMFSSDIKPEPSKIVGLVYPYPLKGGQIKVNTNLVVPKGYSFVIGYKGKALDCFNEGEYVLGPATLPECCKKLKIHKQNDNGSFKKSFKANAYFVKLGEYEYNFKTYDKAELGSRATGIFTVGLTAKIKLTVNEAKPLLSSLLYEYDYIKQNEAEKLINMWTSELVVKILSKYNFALSEFINSNPIIKENLKNEIGRKFIKMGLIIQDITDIHFNLPKKHQKEYEANLAKQQLEENKNQEQDENNNQVEETNVEKIETAQEESVVLEDNNSGIDIQPTDNTYQNNFQQTVNVETNEETNYTKSYQEKVDLLKEEISKNPKNKKQVDSIVNAKKIENQTNNNIEDSYVPFGSIVIEDISSEKYDQNEQKNNELQGDNEIVNEDYIVENNDENLQKVNNMQKPKEDEEPEFVDLNLDNLYNEEPKQGKKCEYCGYVNDMDKTICEVCGTKLNEEN